MIGYAAQALVATIITPLSGVDVPPELRLTFDPDARQSTDTPVGLQQVWIAEGTTQVQSVEVGGGSAQIVHTITAGLEVLGGDEADRRNRRDLIIRAMTYRLLGSPNLGGAHSADGAEWVRTTTAAWVYTEGDDPADQLDGAVFTYTITADLDVA